MISAILIVRNEEKNIKGCLENLNWVDEIIVVDQSSTDTTTEICREFTDKVFVTENKGFCEPDRKFAEEKTKGDWIFYIDADERVSSELIEEIKNTVKSDKYDVYYIPRKNFFLGEWIKHCGWYPAYVPRLFRKGKVKFPDNIHNDIIPLGTVGYLKNDILHYSYVNLELYFEKFNRYTSQLAKEEFEKKRRINYFNLIWYFFVKPSISFFDKYFRKQGFLDGMRGLLISIFTFLTVFVQYIKLWEIQEKDDRKQH